MFACYNNLRARMNQLCSHPHCFTLQSHAHTHAHKTMDSSSCDNDKCITIHVIACSSTDRAMLKTGWQQGCIDTERGAKQRHTDMSVHVALLGRQVNVTFIVLQPALTHNLMSHTSKQGHIRNVYDSWRAPYLFWQAGMSWIFDD